MSVKYIEQNGDINLRTFTSITNELPVGVYAIVETTAGFYLSKRENMDLPEKIYGRSSFPNRVLKTYNLLNRGMGVLLSGPKGTGKTIEAKQICSYSNRPVLIINTPLKGQGFANFLDQIQTPSVIFLDEFEKVYRDKEDRDFLLTILDGTAKSRHLFVLTSNSSDIGPYFTNRPNRIRYHKSFNYLSESLVKEIIEDKTLNRDFIPDLTETISKFPSLSMDALTSLIEEVNLHNELPNEFLDIFNVDSERHEFYDVTIKTLVATPKSKEIGQRILNLEKDEEMETLVELKNDYIQGIEIKEEYIDRLKEYFRFEFKTSHSTYVRVDIRFQNKSDKPVRFRINSFNTIIDWRNYHIKSFTENSFGFQVVHTNGSVVEGTPSRSSWKTMGGNSSDYDDY